MLLMDQGLDVNLCSKGIPWNAPTHDHGKIVTCNSRHGAGPSLDKGRDRKLQVTSSPVAMTLFTIETS